MDTELLVENQIADGQKLIDQLVRDKFPVAVAFWAKGPDDGSWRLYIASPSVSQEKLGEAYRTTFESLRKLPSLCVELSDIRLIPAVSLPARTAMSLRDTFGLVSPNRYRGNCLGPMRVDETWIYPAPGRWFPGFDDIKRAFPSAEVFAIPVLEQSISPALLGNFMGRINAGTFEGKAPGTVLFMGPEASSASPVGELFFVHRPEGWNTVYRPEAKRWEEVRFAATGQPLYQSIDFGPLAALKTKMKPHDEKVEMIKQLLQRGGYITLPPDTTPIYSIPYQPPAKAGEEPRPVIDWEELRKIIELGGVIEGKSPPLKDAQ